MQVKRSMFWAIALMSLFVLQSTSPLLHPVGVESVEMESQGGIEWVQFDLVDGVYSDAVGYSGEPRSRRLKIPTCCSAQKA